LLALTKPRIKRASVRLLPAFSYVPMVRERYARISNTQLLFALEDAMHCETEETWRTIDDTCDGIDEFCYIRREKIVLWSMSPIFKRIS